MDKVWEMGVFGAFGAIYEILELYEVYLARDPDANTDHLRYYLRMSFIDFV